MSSLTDDILSKLLGSEIDGDALTETEFDMFFMLLAVAGNETTRNATSHGMRALLDNPDQFDKLKANPELLPSAIEEILRWATPVLHFRRTAMEDYELGGKQIKKGDKVVIWHISANRDEAVFDDPYRFDIERTPNDHIAFGGGGAHFCLGANLARMELNLIFNEILNRVPGHDPGRRDRVPALELHRRHQAHAGPVHPQRPPALSSSTPGTYLPTPSSWGKEPHETWSSTPSRWGDHQLRSRPCAWRPAARVRRPTTSGARSRPRALADRPDGSRGGRTTGARGRRRRAASFDWPAPPAR